MKIFSIPKLECEREEEKKKKMQRNAVTDYLDFPLLAASKFEGSPEMGTVNTHASHFCLTPWHCARTHTRLTHFRGRETRARALRR